MVSKKQENFLRKIWYDPKHVLGFTGPKRLYEGIKGKFKNISLSQVTDWLQNQDPYSVRRQVRHKTPNIKTPLVGVDYMWDADLADVSNIKDYNNDTTFLLVVVDHFSRYAWVQPLKNKKATTVLEAFKKIFAERKPTIVRSDHGKEFLNHLFQKHCKSIGVTHIASHSAHKAAFAESFIGKLKNILYRYLHANQTFTFIDVLPKLIKSYNGRKHSGLHGFAPKEVNKDTQNIIFFRRDHEPLKKKRPHKFKKGDQVRLSYKVREFRRGWQQKWTEEIFIVSHRYYRGSVPVYKVQDITGEQIEGAFYAQELQRVHKSKETKWKIEEVLKVKKVKGKKLALVRWLGWPKKFDSWIDHGDIESTTKKYK